MEDQQEINALNNKLGASMKRNALLEAEIEELDIVNAELEYNEDHSLDELTENALSSALNRLKSLKLECDNARNQLQAETDTKVEAERELSEIKQGADETVNERVANFDDQLKNTVEVLMSQGKEMHKAEQHEDSIDTYLKAIGVECVSRNNAAIVGACWNFISLSWKALKRFDRAIHAIGKAIECEPKQAAYFHTRACYYEECDQRLQAYQDLEEALSIDPGFVVSKRKLDELKQLDKAENEQWEQL